MMVGCFEGRSNEMVVQNLPLFFSLYLQIHKMQFQMEMK
jgi:hypothetical protein